MSHENGGGREFVEQTRRRRGRKTSLTNLDNERAFKLALKLASISDSQLIEAQQIESIELMANFGLTRQLYFHF